MATADQKEAWKYKENNISLHLFPPMYYVSTNVHIIRYLDDPLHYLKMFYFPHFRDEKTEPQRGGITVQDCQNLVTD